MILFNLVLACIGYVLYKVISSIIATRKLKAFADQNGCKAPFEVPDSFPYGVRRLLRLLRSKKSGEDMLDDILAPDFKDRSTIQFRAFDGNAMLNTCEPANLQAMLATQFNDFMTGERRANVLWPVVGRSIFSSDGPFWEHSRALFRPQFSRDNINDLAVTDQASSKFIEALEKPGTDGWTADQDVLPLLYNFTLDTATDFLFGQSVESQQLAMNAKSGSSDVGTDAGARKAEAFATAFGDMGDGLLLRIRLQSFYWLAYSTKFRKALRTIREFTEPIVQRAIQSAASDVEKEGKKQSLLTKLAVQTQDETELRNQTMAILFAGRDTTSAMLSWAVIRLALHPEIFSKLRSIVFQDMPPGEDITFAKMKGCRYLQHFLNEVLRLHPTVPFNHRVAAKDTTLPVGGGPDAQSPIVVREGQLVLFSVYLLHRRKDLWGEDATDFKPERWEQRYPAWQYLPFLGGPRICLGQQFALAEASYLLVRLLHEFDAMEPVDPAEMSKLRKGLALTMWPRDGSKVRFRKASVA